MDHKGLSYKPNFSATLYNCWRVYEREAVAPETGDFGFLASILDFEQDLGKIFYQTLNSKKARFRIF